MSLITGIYGYVSVNLRDFDPQIYGTNFKMPNPRYKLNWHDNKKKKNSRK